MMDSLWKSRRPRGFLGVEVGEEGRNKEKKKKKNQMNQRSLRRFAATERFSTMNRRKTDGNIF